MTPAKFFRALYDAWTEDTRAPGIDHLGPRSRGQCAVTALVVHDYLGGDLVRAEVELLGEDGLFKRESHYWNRVPGLGDVDLTRDQYRCMARSPRDPDPVVIPMGEIVGRERLLEGLRAIEARTPERYALLKYGVELLMRRSP